MQLAEKENGEAPIIDILKFASQQLMNQMKKNQKSGFNVKSVTTNSFSSTECLKDGNNVRQNASNGVVWMFFEQKQIVK